MRNYLFIKICIVFIIMEITCSIDEKKDMSEILFCNQILKNKDILRLSVYCRKKYKIIGFISGKTILELHSARSRALEITMITPSNHKIWVCYDSLPSFEDSKIDELVRITKLRLYPIKHLSLSLMLQTTSFSKISPVIPDIINNQPLGQIDLKRCFSTPCSRKIQSLCIENTSIKEPLSPFLIINLKNYAKNTKSGVKFSLKSLLKISEKITFIGLVLLIEKQENSFMFVIRDLITNDKINVFISFFSPKPSQIDFLNNISKYFILRITGRRMVKTIQISSNLRIYCKVVLQPDLKNIQILSYHKQCSNKLCPCKFPSIEFFTPNFAPYNFISDIKPILLFRAFIRVHIRVIFVNFIKFKLACVSCGKVLYDKEDFCCDQKKFKSVMIAGVVVEDASGVADGKIFEMETIRELLQLTPELEESLIELADNKGEVFLRYKDLPDSFLKHFKHLSPVLKFCIVHPEAIPKLDQNTKENEQKSFFSKETDSFVRLNAFNDGVQASLKILKVVDN